MAATLSKSQEAMQAKAGLLSSHSYNAYSTAAVKCELRGESM